MLASGVVVTAAPPGPSPATALSFPPRGPAVFPFPLPRPFPLPLPLLPPFWFPFPIPPPEPSWLSLLPFPGPSEFPLPLPWPLALPPSPESLWLLPLTFPLPFPWASDAEVAMISRKRMKSARGIEDHTSSNLTKRLQRHSCKCQCDYAKLSVLARSHADEPTIDRTIGDRRPPKGAPAP